jgi:uncharacterized membrane protein
MTLKKTTVIVMRAVICLMAISMIAVIWLEQIRDISPTQQEFKSFAVTLFPIGLLILSFCILIYLCEHIASRHNQMSNKIRSVTLLLFSVTVFSISSSYLRFYPIGPEYKKSKYESIIGIPAFVTIERKPVPYYTRTNFETVVDVKHKNLILIFTILSIPIFIAGYIWGNKNKTPNQALEPTPDGAAHR